MNPALTTPPNGVILTPERPTNMAWGDDDFTTLYIPNGKYVGHEDFPRKLEWLDANGKVLAKQLHHPDVAGDRDHLGPRTECRSIVHCVASIVAPRKSAGRSVRNP